MGGFFSRFCRDDENTRTPRVTPTITVELDEAITPNLQSPDCRRSKHVRFDNKIQVLEIEPVNRRRKAIRRSHSRQIYPSAEIAIDDMAIKQKIRRCRKCEPKSVLWIVPNRSEEPDVELMLAFYAALDRESQLLLNQ